jgi:hypothetical protein
MEFNLTTEKYEILSLAGMENISLSYPDSESQRMLVFSHMENIGPLQIQAIVYILSNIYRTCIQNWDW